MQSSEKYEQFNKILCNKHNKKIIGVVIHYPLSDKLACLSCAQDQKLLRVVDKDDFIKLIEQKIAFLTTIQQQWIQLSKQFEQFLQNQIFKLSVDFKDKYELNNLINAYQSSDRQNIQTCLGEIQKLIQKCQGIRIEEKQQAKNQEPLLQQDLSAQIVKYHGPRPQPVPQPKNNIQPNQFPQKNFRPGQQLQ